MARQKLGQPHLLIPSKVLFRIMGEFDVVRWVCVDEIFRLEWQSLEVDGTELPCREDAPVRGEVPCIVDALVTPEGYVELALAIETTQAVITGSVEVIEKRGGLPAFRFAVGDQVVKTATKGIKKLRVVAHHLVGLKAPLEPLVEIDYMLVYVIEECARGHQPKREGEPAAQRLHEPPMLMREPEGLQVRNEPTLSARPLQRRSQYRSHHPVDCSRHPPAL